MSVDKKKQSSDSASHVENDRQFLERSGASSQLKEVIAKILENRPEDPVSFLADYFDSLGDKIDRVSKAYQQICLTHYTKPAFANNIMIAYDILAQSKVTMAMDRRMKLSRKDTGKQVKGINGMTYMELLNLMCKEFPPTVRDKLYKKIRCRDFEVIRFDVFKSSIFTCLVLKDFLSQCEGLFLVLDGQKSGKVDHVVCDAIIHQLHEAVKNTSDAPSSVLEAAYSLGPKKLANNLTTAFFKGSSDKRQLSQEDFVIMAADAFLAKVRELDLNEDPPWHTDDRYYVHST